MQELQDVLKLDQVDAHRAAFVVLGINRGWPKARIARWLGISRARVGQRVAKYKDYASNEKAFPVTARLLNGAPARGTQDSVPAVAFQPSDWDDPDFAIEMLNRLG